MLEIPESAVICGQIAQTMTGRTIEKVIAAKSPHGFAWYEGTPDAYPSLLEGRTIAGAKAVAGLVEIDAGEVTMMFGDGVNLRRIAKDAKRPDKHQLLLELDDGSALVASVQMYGGLWAYPSGTNQNSYHLGAAAKPSPLTDAFDAAYFDGLRRDLKPKLSVKAFLATEQRIPGLGNGVLQDILFLSEVQPMRQLATLDDGQYATLYDHVKTVLRRMVDGGGRDTEKDLFGKAGGYRTLMSRKTLAYPCPRCGGPIQRKAYLGGNVYFCPGCQQ